MDNNYDFILKLGINPSKMRIDPPKVGIDLSFFILNKQNYQGSSLFTEGSMLDYAEGKKPKTNLNKL